MFYYFVYLKLNLDLEKQISLVNLHRTLFLRWCILTQLFWRRGELMVNLDRTILIKKVNRGGDLRWVGSRCPLTRALSKYLNLSKRPGRDIVFRSTYPYRNRIVASW